MEKIAIISDVHGNITALNEVLNDIRKRGIDRIFCLGDSIVKCVHPDLVIDKLREVCDVILIGNTDYAICRPEARNKKFWSRIKIGEERANFMLNLPVFHEFYMSGHFIRLFHASPFSLQHIYNPTFSNKGTVYSGVELANAGQLFENTEFLRKTENDKIPDVIGYGHIHTPCLIRYKNKTVFNPGSVGSIPYNIEKEIEDLIASDMPNKDISIRTLKAALPTNYDMN